MKSNKRVKILFFISDKKTIFNNDIMFLGNEAVDAEYSSENTLSVLENSQSEYILSFLKIATNNYNLTFKKVLSTIENGYLLTSDFQCETCIKMLIMDELMANNINKILKKEDFINDSHFTDYYLVKDKIIIKDELSSKVMVNIKVNPFLKMEDK